MPLYVKDDEVLELARELQALIGASSKTEAVRMALRNEIDRQRHVLPVAERLARSRQLAAEIGTPDPDFDFKAFRADLWDEA
ncbi:type II toxin-antitoxin system VapB family antitoxin [Pannonibacter carbonis]|uniref:type II toxin-antitoxin system VapB family antitoxin n=1 Tax=Pannonibacter carbonis TaxID=2067569 RepID=UPI000D0E3DC4|nr:type II toxin-antitoxin system VapB family antitoxin [Pannonibacter carbonis]